MHFGIAMRSRKEGKQRRCISYLVRDRMAKMKARHLPSLIASSIDAWIVSLERRQCFCFSGDTKYFCVKMLRLLLCEYPDDVMRRPTYYQYGAKIDVYNVTYYEVELLNRINDQHARRSYSSQPLTAIDEIVRVSDFLPFYEYLRQAHKAGSTTAHAPATTVRPRLPHSAQGAQRLLDVMSGMSSILRARPPMPPTAPVPSTVHPNLTNYVREQLVRMTRPPPPLLPSRPAAEPAVPQQPVPTVLANQSIADTNTGKTLSTDQWIEGRH